MKFDFIYAQVEIHNHASDDQFNDRAAFLNEVKDAIEGDPTVPVRRVYDSVVLKRTRQGNNGSDSDNSVRFLKMSVYFDLINQLFKTYRMGQALQQHYTPSKLSIPVAKRLVSIRNVFRFFSIVLTRIHYSCIVIVTVKCALHIIAFCICVSAYHNRLGHVVGRTRPSLWILIRHLKDEEVAALTSARQARHGHPPPARRRKYRVLEERIVRLKDDYNVGRLSLRDYWSAVTHVLGSFV